MSVYKCGCGIVFKCVCVKMLHVFAVAMGVPRFKTNLSICLFRFFCTFVFVSVEWRVD